MTNYLVAAIKPWNQRAFTRRIPDFPGEWHLIDQPQDLSAERLASLKPRYVFFPHWSWSVPGEILEAAECVCFHMTDLPFGRGGSPLQNLIVRGHIDTVMTAFRMTDEMDAGPVYMKQPLTLEGTAQEIFERAADLSFNMMMEIIKDKPAPVPQTGEPVIFSRRTPDQNRVPVGATPETLYDHIRMLDAETYPPAFLDERRFADGILRGVFC